MTEEGQKLNWYAVLESGSMTAVHNLREYIKGLEKENEQLKQYCDCMYCKHCDYGDEFTVEGTNETLCEYCNSHEKQNFEPKDK